MAERIVMYTKVWCPDCHRADHFFSETGIEVERIDIEKNPDAIPAMKEANGGMTRVPTIVRENGLVLIEPSYKELEEGFRDLLG